MLYWKNKPIDTLSESELRLALTESVSLVLNTDGQKSEEGLLPAFTAGIVTGLVVSVLGMFIATFL